MSRIGKKPIVLPAGVTAELASGLVKIKGPKGELNLNLHPKVSVAKSDAGLEVKVQREHDKQQRALWGLFRSLIQNMVDGVSRGFSKILEVNGVGYKAAL